MTGADARFKCPFCGQESEGPARYAGTEASCPSCGKRFRLEAIEAGSAVKTDPFMCYLAMFRHYVGFRGRTARREFWWAMLFNTIATFVVAFADGYFFGDSREWAGMIILGYALGTILPQAAIHVRRLHDTGKSGWWVLLIPMPVLNLAYLVWLATAGDRDANRYGDAPKKFCAN